MKLGEYEVERALGSGGMSDALIARSPAGRQVVLKKPRSNDPDLVARMRDEGRLGSRIFHPNLVETLDTFDADGLPVLALGFVEGPTLDELRKKAPLTPAAAARVGCQIAEALGAIHDALGDDGQPMGAVHRDVSGRNIIVTPAGDAVLIDLGIARFDEVRAARTETGMVLGTLRYMAPELVDGIAASPASDFYSLGCVVIEAASGIPAFQGPPSEVAGAIVTKGAMAGEAGRRLEEPLRAVVAKMVAMAPKDRYQHAHEVSKALRDVEQLLGGGARDLAALVATVPQAPGVVSLPPAPAARAATVGRPSSEATEAFTPQPKEAHSSQVTEPFERQQPNVRVANVAGGLPSDGPLAPAPMPPPRFLPPLASPLSPSSAPLELAVEPRSRARPVEPMPEASLHYPKHKADYRWLTDAAGKVAGAVVVLVGLGALYIWYSGTQEEQAKKLREIKAQAEAALLQKAFEDTAGPDCGSAPNAVYIYKDKMNVDVIVDRLDKVPAAYRRTARCAVPAR